MENSNTDSSYKSLIGEIIAKQSIILGPQIAILKAKNVGGLEVDDQGVVHSLTGNPKEIMEKLIDEYVNLSGAIIKGTLAPLFEKYPDIKVS